MESIAIAVCVGVSLLAIGVVFCAKGSDNTDRGIGEDESRIAEPLIFSRGVEAQRTNNNNNNNNNSENQRREPERYQQREINITSSPTAAASVAASVPKFVNRSTGSKQSSTSSNVVDGDVENEFIGAGQVDSRKSKSTKAPGGVSAIFCGCGGPGSLVKLKPCGCRALCLSCAQIEKACPQCNAGITDSVPSFRVTLE